MVWTLWYLCIFCDAAKCSPNLPATTRSSAGEEEI
jgi:hypothetical protein